MKTLTTITILLTLGWTCLADGGADASVTNTNDLRGAVRSSMPGGEKDQLVQSDTYVSPVSKHRVRVTAGVRTQDLARPRVSPEPVALVAEPGKAVTRNAAFQAEFAADLWTRGAIRVVTLTGQVLESTPLGLVYLSPNGESVWLAQVRSSNGELLGSNQIIYRGALAGEGVIADLIFTVTASSLEQDVVIRTRVPSPTECGLPEDSWLAVVTEFYGTIPTRVERRTLDLKSFKAAGTSLEEAVDETLFFGNMRIVAGKAFTLGREDITIPVVKAWNRLAPEQDGEVRELLVESVAWPMIKSEVEKLPEGAQTIRRKQKSLFAQMPLPNAPVGKSSLEVQVAQLSLDSAPGVVLDYLLVNSALLNINFGEDTKTGPAALGYSAGDYWNALLTDGTGSIVLENLVLSDGWQMTEAGVCVSNAPATAVNFFCLDPMYNTYVHPTNGGRITVTITNLPSDEYDVLVYATRASEAGSPTIELKRGQTTIPKATTIWGNGWRSRVWDEGEQYVRFRNIAITNEPLTLEVWPDASGYASLSGIQIASSESVPPRDVTISDLLNVNFAGYPSNKVGYAAIGIATNDYWNGYAFPGQNAVSVPNLLWSDQAASGVGMVVRAASGWWSISMFDPMLERYIYSSQRNIAVTLTNLPTGTYDILLYGHRIVTNDNGIFSLWSDDVSAGVKGTSYLGYGPTSNRWEVGQQYVEFKDVPVTQDVPVTFQSLHNTIHWNGLSGMQVARTGALDSDSDGLPDAWEYKWFGSLASAPGDDSDGDYLTNLREYKLGLDPDRADSDGDGVIDALDSEIDWVRNSVPQGAYTYTSVDTWNWVTSWYDGTGWGGATVYPLTNSSRMHVSALASGLHQHYFERAISVCRPGTGDVLYAYINLDPSYSPAEVMLQWYVLESNGQGSWEHRAYWGANNINSGVNGTISRRYMGPLPASNTWVRLEVPAADVGLEGRLIEGMAFTLYGGRAAWDQAGALNPDMDADGLVDYADQDGDGLSNILERILGTYPTESDSDDDGVNDFVEYSQGRNPLVPYAVADTTGAIGLNVYTPLK